MTDREKRLQVALAEAIKALEANAKVFRNYSDQHAAKGTTTGYAKAQANLALAHGVENVVIACKTLLEAEP